MEKIKKIRQSFSNAVTNGRRSGSGQIVLEHYDTLTNLSSGSALVETLKFDLESSSSSISTNINSPVTHLEVEDNSFSDVTNDASGSILADVEGNSSTPNTLSTPKFTNKRKGDDENCVCGLISKKAGILRKDCHSLKEMRSYSRKQKRKACLKWNSVRQ